MMLTAIGRGAPQPAGAAVPVATDAALVGTDTSRSAAPSGAPTLPEDLPPDLDDTDEPAETR